ncbi:hypothetical protein SynPROS91_01148 [Synechococcus sp. PROS-9-1]|nr:hypothetical protein SynPROS91_01148 [Synechococcus sp. PROS-9-1]
MGNEFWAKGDGASLYKLSTDGCGTEIEMPIQAAKDLFHLLGAMLEMD